MDLQLVTLVLLLIVVVLLVLLVRGRNDNSASGGEEELRALRDMLAKQEGRLAQMSEDHRKSQGELTKAVQERLDHVGLRMGQSLEEAATKTAKSMGELHTRLKVIDEAQENLKALSGDIMGLQNILDNKQARGAFGETQLRAILDDLLPPDMFSSQVKLSNGKIVDFQLLMPLPSGPLSIDSKFPSTAYERMQKSDTDEGYAIAKKQFKVDVKGRISEISEKYLIPGETAEFAVMFVPSEAIFAEIHAHHRDLVELGHRSRVNIVSPSTLWASILAIKSVFRDIEMQKQASVIQQEVVSLLDETGRLDQRIDDLAKHFGALGKLEEDIRKIRITTDKITTRSNRIRDVRLDDDVPEALGPVDGPGIRQLSD